MFLNYDYSATKINLLLDQIKEKNNKDLYHIKEIVKCIIKVHNKKIENNHSRKYNCKQLISKVSKAENLKCKDEIILSLEIINQVEHYNNSSVFKNGYLVWDLEKNRYSDNINDMYVGSYIWDIAAILTYMNNPKFSEIFIDNYLMLSGNKITLSALYSNIFYIQVYNALIYDDEASIIKATKQILQDGAYHSELISYETLKKLNILGYT